MNTIADNSIQNNAITWDKLSDNEKLWFALDMLKETAKPRPFIISQNFTL